MKAPTKAISAFLRSPLSLSLLLILFLAHCVEAADKPSIQANANGTTTLKFPNGQTFGLPLGKGLLGPSSNPGSQTPFINADGTVIAINEQPERMSSFIHIYLKGSNGRFTEIENVNRMIRKAIPSGIDTLNTEFIRVERLDGMIMDVQTVYYDSLHNLETKLLRIQVGSDGKISDAQLSIDSQTFDFEKTKSKGDQFKAQTLVFKGFYLGMPARDAQALINKYMGQPQTSPEPEPEKPKTTEQQDSEILGVAIAKAFGVSNEPNAPFKVFHDDKQISIARSRSERPFAIANGEGKVVMFELSKSVRDKLFDASATPTSEFLETFITAYDIPSLDASDIDLTLLNQKVGSQSILQHRSPKGYEITFYDKPLFSHKAGTGVLVPHVPAEHITIKMISTEVERRSKFD